MWDCCIYIPLCLWHDDLCALCATVTQGHIHDIHTCGAHCMEREAVGYEMRGDEVIQWNLANTLTHIRHHRHLLRHGVHIEWRGSDTLIFYTCRDKECIFTYLIIIVCNRVGSQYRACAYFVMRIW